MSTSDDLVLSAARAVVQTVADTVGHAATAATHIIATPTRAAVNAASAVAVSAASLVLFGAAKLTMDGAWWIGATVAGAATTVAYAGYSTLFPQPTIQYVALPPSQQAENKEISLL